MLIELNADASDAVLAEAYLAGRRLGLLKLGCGLNPYPAGSAEYAEWHRGWFSALPNPNDHLPAPLDDEQLNAHARADEREQRSARSAP